MISISILKESKDYVVVKMPRKMADDLGFKRHLTEDDILRISKEAVRLARKGVLPTLRSLRDLR
ncbi:MAG: hypothetical protein Q7R85_01020 [bacterium]|nr:hypothetical protein [bacterium]